MFHLPNIFNKKLGSLCDPSVGTFASYYFYSFGFLKHFDLVSGQPVPPEEHVARLLLVPLRLGLVHFPPRPSWRGETIYGSVGVIWDILWALPIICAINLICTSDQPEITWIQFTLHLLFKTLDLFEQRQAYLLDPATN